jgi:hypothetical protein
MASSEIWMLKVALGSIAGIFGVLAAICTFLDLLYAEKQEPVQTWFRMRWDTIGRSPWLSLPEKVIGGLLRWEERFKGIDPLSESRSRAMTFLWCVTPVPVLIAVWIHDGAPQAFFASLVALPCLFLLLHDKGRQVVSWIESRRGINITEGFMVGVFSTWVFGNMIATGIWIDLSLKMNLLWALLTMTLLLPTFWLLIWTSGGGPTAVASCILPRFRDYPRPHSVNRIRSCFALGASASFVVTYLSLLLGHIARPTAPVPQTFQMLLSNAVFDGCTVIATVLVLRWAVSKRGMLRLPVAITVDVVIAAIFACGSLYFALVGRENALSIRQVLDVLVGQSANSSGWELGPYFWAMHTTFIPTAVYLSIIFFSWLAKCVLTVAHWFFEKGQEHKNPLKLTAAACGVIVAIFGVGAIVAGAAQEYVKRKGTPAPMLDTLKPPKFKISSGGTRAPPQIGSLEGMAPSSGIKYGVPRFPRFPARRKSSSNESRSV